MGNMRRVIAAINMTLDGYCDHTAILAGEDLHNHYTGLLNSAGVLLYGRVTYQLMEFWRTLINKPSGEKSLDDFAIVMNQTPKIVFSRTLKNTGWETAKIAESNLAQTVRALKFEPGKNIFVGSRSIMLQLMQLSVNRRMANLCSSGSGR